MAKEILKILGQARPAAATEVVLYSVPKGHRAAISRFLVVNNSGGNSDITVSVVPGGSNNISGNPTDVLGLNSIVDTHTLATKVELPINLNKITLDEFDDIRVVSSALGVVFHVYGVEVTPEKT